MEPTENKKQAQMDIIQLEQRVEELIRACSTLKEENDTLRQKQGHLIAERAELIEKTELARTRVEAMITRLKAMENGQ
jgi:cell division protein ZapB